MKTPIIKTNVKLETKDNRHDYLDENGNQIKKLSVTELVKFIYPFDISKIDPLYLKLGRERGNCLHKRLEIYLKNNFVIPCKCEQGKQLHNKYFEKARSILKYIDKKYGIVKTYSEFSFQCKEYVGTIDLLVFTKIGIWIIIDFKTTSWKKKTDEEFNDIYLKEALQLFLYVRGVEPIIHKKINKWIIINPNKSDYGYQITEDLKAQAKKDWLKIKKHLK